MTALHLNPADRYFFDQERPGFPMVIGALIVVDTLGASPREACRQLSEYVAGLIPGTGLLKVLRDGPEGMRWDDAEQYSSQHHVHAIHQPLPLPSAAADFIQEISTEALDLDQPPFGIWIIDDMGADRAGLIIRVHHGFADGAAFLSILNRLTTPVGTAPFAGSYIDRSPAGTPGRPPSRADRDFAFASFPFSALRQAAGARGGSVNVLLLTLLAEAIRSICETSGVPLPKHVLVRVAANMRESEEDTPGNKIAPMDIYLRTNISSASTRFADLRSALSDARSAARSGGRSARLEVPEVPKMSFAGVLGWPTARFLGRFPVLYNFPIPMLTPSRFLSMGLRRCGSTLDVGLMTRSTGDFTARDILTQLSSAVNCELTST